MPRANPETGSFRDRRGRIYYVGDRVLRTVMPMAVADFEFVRATGLIEALVNDGRLVAEKTVDKDVLGADGIEASLVLEHPRLPCISYPYEWCFSALQDAALLHLDIQIEALRRDVALTDASAYNVQFVGAKPVFIDNLSFRRYADGEYWDGHRQFCEQFANPLLLRSALGVCHNAWYRGSLEGITADELRRLLPWRSRLSWNVLTHVIMQARLQRSAGNGDALAKAQARRLPKIGYEQILSGLRRWIAKLSPRSGDRSVWQDYAGENSYADTEATAKRGFIADFVSSTAPGTVVDIGCNTGDFSVVALENGAERCIGFDFDHGALEAAYRRARENDLNFTPLFLDAANPSPDQGWLQAERRGFSSRAKGDAVFALALVHHLAIAKNIPLQQVLNWLLDMAPRGVVEFVPKNDAMVQRLLQNREDLFDDYSPETFESLLGRQARIEKTATVSSSGRTLYWYERD